VGRSTVFSYLLAIRAYQWLKNALVFAALVFSGEWTDRTAVLRTALLFVAFCLVASGTYLINDLLDLEADRAHPTKRHRPLAAGAVSVRNGRILASLLVTGGIALAAFTSPSACAFVLVYLVLTLAYSLYLKEVVLIDSLLLAGLYTIRVIAGAAVIAVRPSVWLLAFSMFIFFSLALVKRCTELQRMADQERLGARGRDYRVADAPYLSQMGIASGYAAILVVALYIDSTLAGTQYRAPALLWLVCPLLLYWVSRLWIKTGRREMSDDPIIYAMKDRTSWLIFIGLGVVWVMARLSPVAVDLWR